MLHSRAIARHGLGNGILGSRHISTVALRSSLLAQPLCSARGSVAPSVPTLDGNRFYAARKSEHGPVKPKAASKVKATPKVKVVPTKGQEQLDEALELRYRLSSKKSRIARAKLIADYPEVRAVLDLITSPEYDIGLPWPQMVHYITAKRTAQMSEAKPPFLAPESLVDLLRAIGKGDLTQAQIKELLFDYLQRQQIDLDGLRGTMLKELMHRRFLDGMGTATLAKVPESASQQTQGDDAPAKGNRLTNDSIKKYHRKRAATANWGFPAGYIGKRAYSTTRIEYPNPEVVRQLQDLRELKVRVNGVNQPAKKYEILREYPQLRELLETIHGNNFRTNLTYDSFVKFVAKYKDQGGKHSTIPPPSTIVELLQKLARKSVTGEEAKAMVRSFLDNHDVQRTDPNLVHVFGGLLNRSLAMGVSTGTLKAAWDGRGDQGPSANLSKFAVALGTTIDDDPSLALNPKYEWYASRKLDGIRCITTMDIFVPSDQRRPLSLVNLSLASRNNKDFSSLAKLKPQLERLLSFPKLRQYLETDSLNIEEQDGGVVKRLILDGECCVMVPVSSLKDRAAAVLTSETAASEHQRAAAELWKDDGLIEDFKQTQSQVKRQTEVVQHPRYFLFDLIPGGEFTTGGATTTFSERNARLREMVDWLEAQLINDKVEERMIKRLVQIKVDLKDLDGMYARSAEEGWEGLIFRADKPYRGTRSTDIRKYKKFKDDEYKVIAVVPNTLRLSINGQNAEYNAAASVTIVHNGTEVQVGSGMTPEERVRWAKDPSSIIGKTITVKYFEESTNQNRPGQTSLRFPVIKAVYGSERDM